ncbi:MAG: hypothetical protein ABIP48_16060 [Planctomycetota bacterium]
MDADARRKRESLTSRKNALLDLAVYVDLAVQITAELVETDPPLVLSGLNPISAIG